MLSDAGQVPPDVQQVIDRTSDSDWEALILQLGRYTLQKGRRFFWRTGRAGELPGGEVTESLVSKALLLWMSGRRRWNREEYADLRGFLEGVIDSLLSHSATGSDNRTVTSDEALLSAVASAKADARSVRMTPESELLEKERAAEMDQMLAEIVRQSQSDIVALEIIDAIHNGATTRRDIVLVTGRRARDIDNGLKRLRRVGATIARSRKSGSYEHQKA
jgi:hypothetical protein